MTRQSPAPFELIHPAVDRLSVDGRYQRAIKTRTAERLIASIIKDFNWLLFGVPIVATDGADGFTVIDGQHRVEAARRMGFETIPCLSVDAETLREQASAFVGINKKRRRMSAVEIYHAELAAADPVARSVRDGLAEFGLTVSRYVRPADSMKDNEVACVGTLKQVLRWHKPAGFRRILRVLTLAWPDAAYDYRPSFFRGLGRFIAKYDDAPFDENRLIEVMATIDPQRLQTMARQWRDVQGGSVEGAVCCLLAKSYNAGLRKAARLPV